MENNRAFLFGDCVSVYFFVRNEKLILAEECYFFLMASMRKMRMKIPLNFTLEYFTDILIKKTDEEGLKNAFIHFIIYRNNDAPSLTNSSVKFSISCEKTEDILTIKKQIKVDLLRDISVNTSLLDNIITHSPENIYAQIYAQENDLDELLLLNPNKRIARGIFGNFLFLEKNIIRIPKQSEGAYISPLMENFITFVHKNKLSEIEQAEMSPFESQKSDEILFISDQKGLFLVSTIRNKAFNFNEFQNMVEKWKISFTF